MSNRIVKLVTCAILACPIGPARAQPPDEKKSDLAEGLPAPPQGFDTRRDDIHRGKLETVEYDSTTVGIKRKARVYTPPGYTTDQKYPVLYLLHGIGGDENEWARGGKPDVILDNLYADKQTVPIAVGVLQGQRNMDATLSSASALLGILPCFLFFLLFQRTLTRGIAAGSVK